MTYELLIDFKDRTFKRRFHMSKLTRTLADLLALAGDLYEKALESGLRDIIKAARNLNNKVTDYVQAQGRTSIAAVYRAFDALTDVLSNPEFKKALAVDIFVKIMVEVFLHLAKLNG